MKDTVFARAMAVLLCMVMLVGVLPLHTHAEEAPAGLSEEEKNAVISRSMGGWIFPVAEQYYADAADFSGCRGNSDNALYGGAAADCISGSHEASQFGNDGMDIRVPGGVEVYAPVEGWFYRSGNTAVIEQSQPNGYSYYLILTHVSEAAIPSASYVSAGDVIGYTDGSVLHFSAVMAYSAKGEQIAADPQTELSQITANGWLTQPEGIGMLCVNPSGYTQSQYPNYASYSFPGPITYTFHQSAPEQPPVEESQPPVEEPQPPVEDVHTEHEWDGGVITTQPTHFSSGLCTYTCQICGQTKTEEIPASAEHVFDQQVANDAYLVSPANCLNPAVYNYSCVCGERGLDTFPYGTTTEHEWDGGVITTQPTHGAPGVRTYTCKFCGATQTETVAADANHVFDQQVATDAYLVSPATCQSPALYSYSCLCGERGSETFAYGEAVEHQWDAGVITTQPGHAANGVKTYTCTTCGAARTETVIGESHVYDQEVVADKYLKAAASCTEPAVYFKSCVCGEMGTDTFVSGEARGHTFSNIWSHNEQNHWQAATCGHDVKQNVGDHIWDGGKITVQPTASTKGERTFTCIVCGQTRTETLEPTTHTHTFATNWTGNDSYHWHPASCEHTAEKSDFGEHVWDGGVVTVQPTHTTKGEKLYTCQVCSGMKREAITETHVFDQQIATSAFLRTNATCTSAPTYYKSCICGARSNDFFTSGYPAGHSFSSTWSKDETYHWHACTVCGAKGDITSHYYGTGDVCTTCGQTRTDGHIHTSHLARVPGKTSTCTAEGNIGYYVCDCGKWFTDVTATVEILDHSSVVTPAAGHVDKDGNGRCDICKERLDTETQTYLMTEGADSTWINTSGQGMVFRSSSDFGKFDHVEVDGATVSSLNYTVSSGSTIVELNVNYLKRLTVGQHKIAIVAADGRAEAAFSVKQGSASAEKQSGSGIWIFVAVVAVVALVAAAAIAGYPLYTGNSPFPKKKKKGGKFSR